MEFGKLPSIENIQFELPPDSEETRSVLNHLPIRDGLPRLYIGGTGWSMKEWVGNVYPQGTKSSDYLKQYGKQFNTIELNTTYYRIPDSETILNWKNQTPEDFRFCPKIPQTISHSHHLGLGTGLIEQFCDSIGGLEEKLGCCFLQLPPHFGEKNLGALDQFISRFPGHIPLAIELRNEQIFKSPLIFRKFFNMLEYAGISPVITDVAGRRDVLHQRLTNERVLIRFVGNNLHPTDYTRTNAWIKRLSDWFDRGLHEAFFFTHEPDNLLAPELAVYLRDQAQKEMGVKTRGPHLLKDQNTQFSLFD